MIDTSKQTNLLIIILCFIIVVAMMSISCGDKVVVADERPSITIVSPVNYQKVYNPMIVQLDVVQPEIFESFTLVIDSAFAGEDSTKPFELYWEPHIYATNTTHELWVLGETYGGDDYYSQVVIFIVDTLASTSEQSEKQMELK